MKMGQHAIGALVGLALTLFCSPVPSRAADALDHWVTNQLADLHHDFGGGKQVFGIAYGNGRYVAVGQYSASDFGFIQTSEDGIHWTTRGDGPDLPPSGSGFIFDLYDVTFGNGLFVAVGYDFYGGANLYSSTNGINWATHTNATVSNFYHVTYGNAFVAVGDGFPPNPSTLNATNRNIYTSVNGTNWFGRVSGAPVNNVSPIYDVAYGAGRYVAVDAVGNTYTSTSLTSWTQTHVGGLGRVSFCNNTFIIPAGPGSNLVSSDGLAWSVLTNATGSTFGKVIYGKGLYLALSDSSIFTSTNATNWIQRNVGSAAMFNVAFGPTNAVAVGFTGIYGSYVGYTFTSDSFVGFCLHPTALHTLDLSGLLNHLYEIDYKTNLTDANWNPLATISLTNSPCLWTDASATNTQRYYRTGLLP